MLKPVGRSGTRFIAPLIHGALFDSNFWPWATGHDVLYLHAPHQARVGKICKKACAPSRGLELSKSSMSTWSQSAEGQSIKDEGIEDKRPAAKTLLCGIKTFNQIDILMLHPIVFIFVDWH